MQAHECIDCHIDVAKQFRGNSHHIQGTGVAGKHCYACHWEATIDGRINKQYHPDSSLEKPAKDRRLLVNLVVWRSGQRPTVYTLNETALIFMPSDISTANERIAVATVTRHCLGCHSDQNNDTRPFEKDSRTPREYAWDGQSVASRYSNKGTAAWGKYSTATTNKKQHIVKSFSAHGNATANQGGWSPTSGYDDDIPITRGGSKARNIECLDCHNSHGSTVSSDTSSYLTYNGSLNGGILKETQAGKGGYQMTYKPSANLGIQNKNPYNAGAGLCFDCHETAMTGTTPWGYKSTFGATQPIMGYKDTHRFGSGNKGSTARYQNRLTSTEIASSHLKSGKFLNYSTKGKINGLCTPCHDPHGVSRTLGDNMPYALPLLKGSWMTSPYREDGPPSSMSKNGDQVIKGITGKQREMSGSGIISFKDNAGASNLMIDGKSLREPMPGLKYNIDRNTFGVNNQIVENDSKFGGLCFNCHSRNMSEGDSVSARVHRSVKGWGYNKEHAFPCSKCHQAHNSGLPRLMQTNFFVAGPAGLRDNTRLSWVPKKNIMSPSLGSSSQSPIHGTDSATNKKAVKKDVVGCHISQFGGGNATSNKQETQPWKQNTAW